MESNGVHANKRSSHARWQAVSTVPSAHPRRAEAMAEAQSGRHPNGGTAASPASIAANSRYVSGNPFPGSHVLCELEVLYSGVWQSPGFSGSGYQQFLSHGAQASMYGAGEIIVQTGINSVVAYSAITGGGGGIGSGVFVTSAPCRVKVWKSKGAI